MILVCRHSKSVPTVFAVLKQHTLIHLFLDLLCLSLKYAGRTSNYIVICVMSVKLKQTLLHNSWFSLRTEKNLRPGGGGAKKT